MLPLGRCAVDRKALSHFTGRLLSILFNLGRSMLLRFAAMRGTMSALMVIDALTRPLRISESKQGLNHFRRQVSAVDRRF